MLTTGTKFSRIQARGSKDKEREVAFRALYSTSTVYPLQVSHMSETLLQGKIFHELWFLDIMHVRWRCMALVSTVPTYLGRLKV